MCRQVALGSARLWSSSCCYSWLAPPVFPSPPPSTEPQQNLHNQTDSLQFTFCHNRLRLLTDSSRAQHQSAVEPDGFGGWCVNAARSVRLSSPPVSQRVSVQGGRTTTSRPGGEISARHVARLRKLICPRDKLSLASHWPVDHVTGCDWRRVTSGQLHQIWPGCSWGHPATATTTRSSTMFSTFTPCKTFCLLLI